MDHGTSKIAYKVLDENKVIRVIDFDENKNISFFDNPFMVEAAKENNNISKQKFLQVYRKVYKFIDEKIKL